MSSNIAQSYPYTSETEAERAATVEALLARFDGLREQIAAETTPLGPVQPEEHGAPPRWWVFVCPDPADDFAGRLHVAGYARERKALYVICDTCGKTYLR